MVSGPSGSRASLRTSTSPSARARSRSAAPNGMRATAGRSSSGRTARGSKPRAAEQTRRLFEAGNLHSALAADLVHLARLGRAPEVEPVSGRLGAHGAQQEEGDRVEAGAGAQRPADVELVV